MKKWLAIISCVIIMLSLFFYFYGPIPGVKAVEKYYCDVNLASSDAQINVYKKGSQQYTISTNPLTLKNSDAEVVSTSVVEQDDYRIINSEGLVTAVMSGKTSFWGSHYDIYNADKTQIIAFAQFNICNTSGIILGIDGSLWAEYTSKFLCQEDFYIRITKNCLLDDETILNIIASFYYDKINERP